MRPARPIVRGERAGPPARRRLAAACACAALLLAAPGCGGSGHAAGGGPDPARVVPATAAMYAAADLRPQGAERAAALAVGRSLTGQADPYLRLLAALQTPGSPALDYQREVAPWLGPHGAVFLTSLSGAQALLPVLQSGLLGGGLGSAAFPFASGAAQGAIVLDVADAGRARSFLRAQAVHAGAHAAAHAGVPYEVTGSGVGFALVAGYAVIGSESGLRAVIDTATHASPSLAAAAGYARLQAVAPAGALAHIYVNPLAGGAGHGQAAAGVLGLLAGARESNVSIVPAKGSLAIDADTRGGAGAAGGLLSASAEGTRALGELPGDSWLALGFGDLGTQLASDIAGLRELASLGASLGGPPPGSASASSGGPFSVKALLEGLLAPLTVLASETPQSRAAFTGWMGPGALFASGASLLELKGAIVIESKDPARSRAAVAALATRLHGTGAPIQPASIAGTDAAMAARVKGLPVQLYIADGRDAAGHTKFVLGLSEASVTDALAPSSTFASAPARGSAASALGEGSQPSLAFDVPTLVSLLEGIGLGEDPTLSKVLPYLRQVTSIAGGGHALGNGLERARLVIGLR